MSEPCIILGRRIGTYTGYHLIDTILKIKGFEPDPSLPNLPSGELVFDFDWGKISQNDKEFDLIEALAKAPKADQQPPSDNTSAETPNGNNQTDPNNTTKPSSSNPAPLPKL